MGIYNLFKARKKFFLFLLIILVILLGTSIVLIDRSHPLQGPNSDLLSIENSIKEDYRGVMPARIINSLTILENNTSSKQDKYQALKALDTYVSINYSDSNDPNLRNLLSEVNNYAKNNFSGIYRELDFAFSCQDPECADSPQPKDILTLIDKINQSDAPDDLKQSIVQNLKDTGYLPSKENDIKFSEYYATLISLRAYDKVSTSSAISSFIKDLADYLASAYPSKFKDAENSPLPAPPPGYSGSNTVLKNNYGL